MIEIIELRQKDAINVLNNGQYENILNSNVIEINDGDQVNIKNVFLDTTQESQYVFDNDVNLKIDFGVYIVDWRGDTNKQNYQNSDGSTPSRYLTGDMYMPFVKTVGQPLDPNIFEFVEGLDYTVEANNDPTFGPFTFTYSYNDINNITRTIHKTYDNNFFFNGDNPNTAIIRDLSFKVIIRKGTFNLNTATNQDDWDFAGIIGQPKIEFGANPSIDDYQPHIFTANLVFPKGVYSAQEFSNKLSEVMTNNSIKSSDTKSTVLNNPFLKVISDFDLPNDPSGNPQFTNFYNQDLTNRFNFKKGSTDYIGASQIDFNYDQVSNKFQLLFSHVPIYDDDAGTNISIRYLREGSGANNDINIRAGNIYTVGKHSGIYFNSLTATDSVSGKNIKFWENLGFNLGELCVERQNKGQLQVFNEAGIYTSYNLVDGITTCNAFVGTDSIVIKKKNEWFKLPESSLINSNNDIGITATSEATIPINATKSIPQVEVPFSHYLISVDMGMSNTYIDSNTIHKQISSIVSRYYSYGNYTSDDGAGSIVYVHKGNPIYFKSAKVQILNADKNIDTNLGADNTIIIQIFKKQQ